MFAHRVKDQLKLWKQKWVRQAFGDLSRITDLTPTFSDCILGALSQYWPLQFFISISFQKKVKIVFPFSDPVILSSSTNSRNTS